MGFFVMSNNSARLIRMQGIFIIHCRRTSGKLFFAETQNRFFSTEKTGRCRDRSRVSDSAFNFLRQLFRLFLLSLFLFRFFHSLDQSFVMLLGKQGIKMALKGEVQQEPHQRYFQEGLGVPQEQCQRRYQKCQMDYGIQGVGNAQQQRVFQALGEGTLNQAWTINA